MSDAAVRPLERDEAGTARARYTRIVLKISGEALMGRRNYGVDPEMTRFIAEQVREACTHACRPLKRTIPLVVDELRRIEPRALLRLEGDIGPGLM